MGLIIQTASQRRPPCWMDAFAGWWYCVGFELKPASLANVSCSYLKYASLPSVSLDNVVFEHSGLYLPFSVIFAISSRYGLEGLFESLSYIKGCANLPATFILLFICLSLQWPPRTINILLLLCSFLLKLGSQSIKMPGCFSWEIGFIPFDVLCCVSSLGPERKLQHAAISLGAAPQDQAGQNKRGRKKKSWICT